MRHPRFISGQSPRRRAAAAAVIASVTMAALAVDASARPGRASRHLASAQPISPCAVSKLSVSSQDLGESAGFSHLGLTAANHGPACTLSGIPAISVTTDSGRPIYRVNGSSAVRDPSGPLLTIPAGGTGSVTLGLSQCDTAAAPKLGRLALTFPHGDPLMVPFAATPGCDGQQIVLEGVGLGAPPPPPGFEPATTGAPPAELPDVQPPTKGRARRGNPRGGVRHCDGSQLGLEVAGRTAGANSAFTAFGLINNSRRSCELNGFPSPEAITSSGKVADIRLSHAHGRAPERVTLRTRGVAYFTLQTHGAGGRCVKTQTLRVLLPHKQSVGTVRFPATLCDGSAVVSPIESHPDYSIS